MRFVRIEKKEIWEKGTFKNVSLLLYVYVPIFVKKNMT